MQTQIRSRAKMARKKKSVKNGNGRLSSGNDQTKISLASLKAPSYEAIKKEIAKKLGTRPERPKDLPGGNWTEQALKVLAERYLIKNNQLEVIETPEEMCWRVAWEVASAEARWGKNKSQVLEQAREFYRLLVNREFLPNSPTLMNAGTGNKLQYSACFVLPVEDSMEGIFDAIKYQAIIHKTGGGTGFSFTSLRPRGSVVKTSSGTASGPVSFMRIFDAATNEVKQGGKRRGANMGILRVDHPDILEFIHCKEEGGITNFNISVAITDVFMEAYDKDADYDLIDPKTKNVVGKLNARKVFDEIAEGAWKTGDPGLVFIDRRNKGTSNPVPALGPIEATNPCVTGDTMVFIDKGLVKIEDLYQAQGVFRTLTSSRLSDVKFQIPTRLVQTGKKQVYRLTTKEGYELRLTADHKILTDDGWVRAQDLKRGDRILLSDRKGGFGVNGSLEEGQVLGWLVGDGTIKETSAVLSFFGYEKRELAPKFAGMVAHLVDGMQVLNRSYSVSAIDVDGRDEARVQSTRLARYLEENGLKKGSKLKVPERVFSGREEMQKGFLQGLLTADGHVEGSPEKGVSVRLTSISESLLKDAQRLLLNFGIVARIYTQRRKKERRFLPDGHGGSKEYLCSAYHDLVISKTSLKTFKEKIGFLSEAKNVKLDLLLKKCQRGPYKQGFFARFEELIKEGIEMVYDLTEPATSSFIANGLVVHNCGEQELYPFDACNLGSIFLTYFIKEELSIGSGDKKVVDWEKLREVARTATRFLDNVIEVNPYPLEQIRKTVFNVRRIGLGVGGWADMLIELGIPYDSDEAMRLGEKVMEVIQEEAVETSKNLAKERGAFPLWPISIYRKETPRRNATVTTIAPTGTISIIAGASSGIEPLFAIVFQHIVKDKHLDRRLTFVNPKFEEIAKERGFWSQEIMEKVVEHGVIRDIEAIPRDIRELLGTAHEIDVDWHVRVQSVFQKYTENAVSKTINLRNQATVDDIKKAYLMAWQTECKGITVFRDGCKDAQVLNLGIKDDTTQPLVVRPPKLSGSTYRLTTPVGTAFVTINHDEVGNPLEVFINIGKAGSEVAAMAEALGRTISTALRFRGGLTPIERVKEIAHQLSGIGGRRSVGFGSNKILSLPDALSVALSLHCGFKVNGNGQYLTNGEIKPVSGAASDVAGAVVVANGSQEPAPQAGSIDPIAAAATSNAAPGFASFRAGPPRLAVGEAGDLCPSCGVSAFIYEEGCAKCYSCGYAEC